MYIQVNFVSYLKRPNFRAIVVVGTSPLFMPIDIQVTIPSVWYWIIHIPHGTMWTACWVNIGWLFRSVSVDYSSYHDHGFLMSMQIARIFGPSHATYIYSTVTIFSIQIGRWTRVVPPPTSHLISTAPRIFIIVPINCWETHALRSILFFYSSSECIPYIIKQ